MLAKAGDVLLPEMLCMLYPKTPIAGAVRRIEPGVIVKDRRICAVADRVDIYLQFSLVGVDDALPHRRHHVGTGEARGIRGVAVRLKQPGRGRSEAAVRIGF